MSNETALVKKPEYTQDQIDLIARTVAKGATADELNLFLYQARRTGLDPLAKQIHAVKRWDSTEGKSVMTIQTGIDGYRLIASRTGQHAGTDDAVFVIEAGKDFPQSATVTVWKMVSGQRCGFTATARYSEYCQKKKDGSPTAFWVKMPFGQLAKCAESLALRKAFPAELSSVYTHEEMQQASAEPVTEVLPEAITEEKSETAFEGEVQTTTPRVNNSGKQCKSCNAPNGKNHTLTCKEVANA